MAEQDDGADMDGEWRADPTGRHQLRWHDGTTWTHHVADDGAVAVDPHDVTPVGTTGTGADTSATSAWAGPGDVRSPQGSSAAWQSGASAGTDDDARPSATSSAPPPSASSTRSSGVRTGWVVAIALASLVVGGIIGFFVGVAADVGDSLESFLVDPLEGADPASGDPLALGGSVDGRAGAEGLSHQFSLAQSGTVTFEITQSDFDTVLEVRDANGALVGDDDDGGEGTRSRLRLSLDAGEYQVVVRPFDFGFGLDTDIGGGSYTLTASP